MKQKTLTGKFKNKILVLSEENRAFIKNKILTWDDFSLYVDNPREKETRKLSATTMLNCFVSG